MNAILYCGIQGAGKSTWYAAHHAATHLRLNLDMLRNRSREAVLLHACLAVGQPFVVDNTNPGRETRRRYIAAAKAAGYSVEAIAFEVPLSLALSRNAGRTGKARVPDVAIRGTLAKLERVELDEGYDRLVRVVLNEAGEATVSEERPDV